MADALNASFELCGSCFILLSVIKLHKDKRLLGFSLWHLLFFTLWGWWNMYYYPSLGQWLSFWGGIAVTLVNSFYCLQIMYYSKWPGGKHGY